jgi:hypothetical protein
MTDLGIAASASFFQENFRFDPKRSQAVKVNVRGGKGNIGFGPHEVRFCAKSGDGPHRPRCPVAPSAEVPLPRCCSTFTISADCYEPWFFLVAHQSRYETRLTSTAIPALSHTAENTTVSHIIAESGPPSGCYVSDDLLGVESDRQFVLTAAAGALDGRSISCEWAEG